MRRALALAAGLACASSARSARAQIVNVQPLVATSDDDEGFGLTLEGATDVRRGNTRFASISVNAIASYRTGKHLFFVMGRGDYGRRFGEVYLDRELEHARYRYTIRGPWEFETFVQHDRDSFRRLALRALGGVGPRVHIVRDYGIDVALGTSAMLEYERVGGGDHPDAGEESVVGRSSSYLLFTSRVLDKMTLGNAIYLQPRFDLPSDLRILSETSMLVAANQRLSFKLSLTSAYDTRPAALVQPLDVTWKTTLAVNF